MRVGLLVGVVSVPVYIHHLNERLFFLKWYTEKL